jgi:hypothetical protein
LLVLWASYLSYIEKYRLASKTTVMHDMKTPINDLCHSCSNHSNLIEMKSLKIIQGLVFSLESHVFHSNLFCTCMLLISQCALSVLIQSIVMGRLRFRWKSKRTWFILSNGRTPISLNYNLPQGYECDHWKWSAT